MYQNNESALRTSFFKVILFLFFSCITSNVVHAGFWSDRSEFADTWWGSSQLHYNFKYANRIDIVLWNSDTNNLAGIATFYKGQQRCIGYVSLQDKTEHLNFKVIEGNACTGLDNSYFKPLRKAGSGIQLTWFPPDSNSSSKLNLVNIAYYRKSKKGLQGTPEYLQKFITKFKTQRGPIKELIAKHNDNHAQIIANAKARVGENYTRKFSEAELIGVWKGQFIDQFNVYPVEVAFWPSTVYGLHRIVGIFSFEGKQCPTGLAIFNVKPEITLFTNNNYLTSGTTKCIQMVGEAHLQLNSSRDELSLYFDPRYNSLSGRRTKTCLDGLPREGCFSLGVLKRSKASTFLTNVINKVTWEVVSPPGQHALAYMKSGEKLSEAIKSAYRKLANKNAMIYAKQIIEGKRIREQIRIKQRASDKRRAAIRKSVEEGSPDINTRLIDLEASKRVLANLSGPFGNIKGGDYLNAIYEGDYSVLRHADNVYLADLQPAIQSSVDMIKMMTPLFKLISGGIMDEKFINKNIKKDLTNLSIFKRVLATYLFNYQLYSNRCLRKDKVKFTVFSSSPDVVFTNYLGVEVSRIYGHSSQDTYFVNKEFETAFRDIGSTQSLQGAGTLVDASFNKGKISNLIYGTKYMMTKFPCDSPDIDRLEENLIYLYNIVAR